MIKPEFNLIDFFEHTPDLVCVAGKDGFLKKVNAAVISKLGYTEEELLSRPIQTFIHPEDKTKTERLRDNLLAGKSLLNFQNRYLTKEGKTIWLEWTSIYFSDREVVFAIAKDITDRKVIEIEVEAKYLKYKNLATHFKSSLEEEKKYLAAELHEELAQVASVIKHDIEWLKSNIPALPNHAKEKIDHAYFMSDLLINTIQRISFSISPKMIEDLGLDAALEWYMKEFSIVTGIDCFFTSDYDESELSHEIKMDFFRICQESLTSFRDHTHPQRITVNILDNEERVTLVVRANGANLDADQLQEKTGISKIQERVNSINGQFALHCESDDEARICVVIEK